MGVHLIGVMGVQLGGRHVVITWRGFFWTNQRSQIQKIFGPSGRYVPIVQGVAGRKRPDRREAEGDLQWKTGPHSHNWPIRGKADGRKRKGLSQLLSGTSVACRREDFLNYY